MSLFTKHLITGYKIEIIIIIIIIIIIKNNNDNNIS